MDKECTHLMENLNHIHAKISSLFQDLLTEKNNYKQNCENISKKFEQVSDEVENLKNEAENLKRLNETLKQSNEDMRHLIDKGIRVLQILDFSNTNLVKDHKISLEILKNNFIEFSKKTENSKKTFGMIGGSFPEGIKKEINSGTGYIMSNEENNKKFEGLNNINFSEDSFYDEEIVEKSPKKRDVSRRNSSISFPKTLFQNKYETIKVIEPYSNSDSSEYEDTMKGSRGSLSPVFRDFAVRKHDNSSYEGPLKHLPDFRRCFNAAKSTDTTPAPSPLKLLSERFLEKSGGLLLNPWKRSPKAFDKSPGREPNTPKKVDKKTDSPERFPCAIIKKSNSRETEVPFSGIKKLKQAFLNVDFYRKTSLQENKNPENRENENSEKFKNEKIVIKTRDDFITESSSSVECPESPPAREDVRKINGDPKFKKFGFVTPRRNLEPDLDETFVSSSIVRKCNLAVKHKCERVIEEQMPSKRQARERSPEYDSVPFVYRREAVRKKAERMKLPGHACAECNKYYENALGDISANELNKILNKCSRHRDKNFLALDDTPPGYWKPYLTCSTINSPNKDDVSEDSY